VAERVKAECHVVDSSSFSTSLSFVFALSNISGSISIPISRMPNSSSKMKGFLFDNRE
jgi:hypothetical protein